MSGLLKTQNKWRRLLSHVLEERFNRESIEIEFTGFISKQEEVVKETLEPKVEESKPL